MLVILVTTFGVVLPQAMMFIIVEYYVTNQHAGYKLDEQTAHRMIVLV
jgi:hypothetical protein